MVTNSIHQIKYRYQCTKHRHVYQKIKLIDRSELIDKVGNKKETAEVV